MAKAENTLRVIAALVLSGRTNGEISDVVRLSESYISALRNTDLFQQKMEELATRIETESVKTAKILQDTASDSAELLKGIIKGKRGEEGVTARLQYDAARDILDRTGHRQADEHIIKPFDGLVIIRNAEDFNPDEVQLDRLEEELLSEQVESEG